VIWYPCPDNGCKQFLISFENTNLGFESINLKAHFQAFKSIDSKPRLSVKIHKIKKALFHGATTVGLMSKEPNGT
jgi:hypothetical protein